MATLWAYNTFYGHNTFETLTEKLIWFYWLVRWMADWLNGRLAPFTAIETAVYNSNTEPSSIVWLQNDPIPPSCVTRALCSVGRFGC